MMAKTFFVLMTVVAMSAAVQSEKKAVPEWDSKSRPAKVPAEAVQVDDYTWRLAGQDGKTWLYRRTPFGIVKFEDKPSPLPAAEETLKVTEKNGEATFERRTPFTSYRWTKKVTELDETEKAALERARQQAKPAAGEARSGSGAAARTQEK